MPAVQLSQRQRALRVVQLVVAGCGSVGWVGGVKSAMLLEGGRQAGRTAVWPSMAVQGQI